MRNVPLNIQLSYYLVSFIVLAHLSAAAILMWLPLASFLKLLLCIFIIGNLLYSLRRQGWQRIVSVQPRADGQWCLRSADGAEWGGQLLGDTYIATYLLILNFKLASGRHRAVVLLPGAVTCESLRRLRVDLLTKQCDQHGQ